MHALDEVSNEHMALTTAITASWQHFVHPLNRIVKSADNYRPYTFCQHCNKIHLTAWLATSTTWPPTLHLIRYRPIGTFDVFEISVICFWHCLGALTSLITIRQLSFQYPMTTCIMNVMCIYSKHWPKCDKLRPFICSYRISSIAITLYMAIVTQRKTYLQPFIVLSIILIISWQKTLKLMHYISKLSSMRTYLHAYQFEAIYTDTQTELFTQHRVKFLKQLISWKCRGAQNWLYMFVYWRLIKSLTCENCIIKML